MTGTQVYLIGTPALATELDAVGVIHEGIGPESTTRSNIFDWARLDVTLNPDIEGVVVGFDPHFNLVKTTRVSDISIVFLSLFLCHSFYPSVVLSHIFFLFSHSVYSSPNTFFSLSLVLLFFCDRLSFSVFLDAFSHLYMRVCVSVRRSVGRLVGPSRSS